MSAIATLRPMSAAQIIGVAAGLVRRSPWLFGGLALAGVAPLAALVLALDHYGAVRRGPRGEMSDAVLLFAFAAALALLSRSFFHAAILRAVLGVLGGGPAEPGRYLAEARTRWLPALVAGGTVAVLGLLCGFLYFIPVAIFGGMFLLALPRVVLDDAPPGHALVRARDRALRQAHLVNFLHWLLAAALFFNLYLLVQLVLALGRSLLDLDVSYVASVLSLDNGTYAVGLACVTVAVLEPVRVIAAGLVHLESKVRREGLDLRVRLELLARPARRRARRAAGVAAALLAFAAVDASALLPPDARVAAAAGAPPAPPPPAPAPLDRLRELVRSHRNAPGERGGFWRTIEAQLARADRLDPARRRAFVAELGAAVAREAADPRDLLARVLTRGEFHDLDEALWRNRPEPPVGEPPLEELLSGLRVGGGGAGISGFTVLAILLVVAAVGAAAAAAAVGLKSRRRASPAPGPQTPPPPLALGIDALERDPAQWRAEADALAARGEHREALRRLYLAALCALHRARALDYDRSRTNWDYLRRFRGPAEARALFRDLTHAFDFVWYGEKAIDGGRYGEMARRADALLARAAPAEAG